MKIETLLPVLIVVMAITCFVACKQGKKDTKPKDKNMITDTETSKEKSFPYDECTSLVFYAGHSLDDDPDENSPKLVLDEYDSGANFLIADNAPILSVLTNDQMLEELANYKNTKKAEEKEIIKKIEKWVIARTAEGYSAFLYELEPPSMAGRAYPVAKKAGSKK